MTMTVPNEADWGDYLGNLDVVHAHDSFFGKSCNEVQYCFKSNIIQCCDDLRWMPIIPFQYYLVCLNSFVKKGEFEYFSRSDVANCFLEIIEEKLEKSPEYINPILYKLMPTIEYVANNQELFEADIDIYGDFIKILKNIKKRGNNAVRRTPQSMGSGSIENFKKYRIFSLVNPLWNMIPLSTIFYRL